MKGIAVLVFFASVNLAFIIAATISLGDTAKGRQHTSTDSSPSHRWIFGPTVSGLYRRRHISTTQRHAHTTTPTPRGATTRSPPPYLYRHTSPLPTTAPNATLSKESKTASTASTASTTSTTASTASTVSTTASTASTTATTASTTTTTATTASTAASTTATTATTASTTATTPKPYTTTDELSTSHLHKGTTSKPTTSTEIWTRAPTTKIMNGNADHCHQDGWYFTIDVTSFGHGLSSSTGNDVYLGERSCHGTLSGDTLIFSFAYGECNTSIQMENGKILFKNSIHLDRKGTSEHFWSIELVCSMDTDVHVEANYSHHQGFQSTDTTTADKWTETSKEPEFNGTSSPPATTSSPVHNATTSPASRPKIHCNTCSGPLCGLFSESETVMECRYCMNSINNADDGTQTIEKSCVSKYECETKWWLDTSDRGECTKFNSASTYYSNFECHFCCVTDRCNSVTVPKRSSLYAGD